MSRYELFYETATMRFPKTDILEILSPPPILQEFGTCYLSGLGVAFPTATRLNSYPPGSYPPNSEFLPSSLTPIRLGFFTQPRSKHIVLHKMMKSQSEDLHRFQHKGPRIVIGEPGEENSSLQSRSRATRTKIHPSIFAETSQATVTWKGENSSYVNDVTREHKSTHSKR